MAKTREAGRADGRTLEVATGPTSRPEQRPGPPQHSASFFIQICRLWCLWVESERRTDTCLGQSGSDTARNCEIRLGIP